MRDNNSNSDVAQNYQLPISRRNLIKVGGSAAGVAAAGGIPATTDIDYPVGQARGAIISGTTALALGIGALAGFGIAGYLGQNQTRDADEVTELENKLSINDVFEIASEGFAGSNGDYSGNNFGIYEIDGDVVWDNKQGNYHRRLLLNTAKNETAKAWSDGYDRSDAIQRGKTAAKRVSVRAEVNLVQGQHNELVGQLDSTSMSAVRYPNDDIFAVEPHDYETDGIDHPTPQPLFYQSDSVSPIESDGSVVGQITDDTPFYGVQGNKHYLEGYAPDGHPTDQIWPASKKPLVLASWNYKSILDSPDDLLSQERRPENYQCLLIGFQDGSILSPYGDSLDYITDHPIGKPVDFGDFSNSSGTLVSSTNYDRRSPTIQSTHDGESYEINYAWILKSMRAILEIRSQTLTKMNSYLGTVYDALEAGQVNLSDVVTTVSLYQDLEPSESQSLSSVILTAVGIEGHMDNKFTIEVDATGNQYTGYLFLDSGESFDMQVGTQIGASEYTELYIIRDEGDKVISDQSITIVAINGDSESSQSVRYEESLDYTDSELDSTTEDEIVKSVKRDQENIEELRQEIRELENDGILGGGGRASGIGSDSIILGALGLGGAYVLFGGGS